MAWCALVGSFTDGVVNPDPAAVELLVSHGAACFFSVIDRHEADESESSGPSLVIRDEIDLVDVAVLRKVTLKVATRRRVVQAEHAQDLARLRGIGR